MAHDGFPDQVLEVRRSAFGEAELHELPDTELADGQIRLLVERFAVTANNVSYAGAGDLLGYWDFFPADEDPQTWGRVPAMGWAQIIESRHPELPVGGRYYGWFPMASTVSFTATATDDGFRDDGAHRAAHLPMYRSYVATDRDPYYDAAPDGEDRHAVLRVLFLTGYLADEFLADGSGGEPYFGAQQVVVLSASSKTAIGFAQRAAKRKGLAVVGLTSAANKESVRSLGFYDSVVTYDEIDDLDLLDSVVIDMAGNPNVLASVHHRLGDRVRYSMMIGRSHHDAVPSPDAPSLTGPAPQFFFVPADVERRLALWGPDEYRRRTAAATAEFIDGSRSWMTIDRRSGPDGVVSAWGDAIAGTIAPNVGVVTSFG
jgi:NADPH:quinone reductase-like Zn-dependent oxidoreductase